MVLLMLLVSVLSCHLQMNIVGIRYGSAWVRGTNCKMGGA